jgi:cytochrome c oxidase cbb3-type subunit IV
MDINDLRSAVTVLLLVMFLGIVAWVYSSKRDRRAFDELAALPLQDELPEAAAATRRDA